MAGRELVTERDVLALPAGARIVLGRQRIATPAALDAAHSRGIEVVLEGDPRAARPAASDILERLRATGGTFVVVAEGGRLTISRLGPNGPEPFAAE